MSESQVRDTIYDMTLSERRALDDAALNVAVAKATGWRWEQRAVRGVDGEPFVVKDDWGEEQWTIPSGPFKVWVVIKPDNSVHPKRWDDPWTDAPDMTQEDLSALLHFYLPRVASDLNAAWALWGDEPRVLWFIEYGAAATHGQNHQELMPFGTYEIAPHPARALTLAWCAGMQAEKGGDDD